MSFRTFSIAAGLCLGLTLAHGTAAVAQTAAPAKELTPQQKRMAECNQSATGKTGDERKTYMSSCLKGETAPGKALTPQQQRMKDCNAKASAQSLAGDKRKTFMSTCLKGA